MASVPRRTLPATAHPIPQGVGRIALELSLLPARTAPLAADFHVRRDARTRYAIPDTFFSVRGDVVLASLSEAHALATLLNRERAEAERIQASHLNAMGLIHEIFHAVIARYRSSVGPDAFGRLASNLGQVLGEDAVAQCLLAFVEGYPPPQVANQTLTAKAYLESSTAGRPNHEWVLEELVLLWLANENPAYAPIAPLIADAELRQATGYLALVSGTRRFFDEMPTFGPKGQNLLDMLLEPMRRAPNSLIAQLEYMRDHWGLDLELIRRILLASDFVEEEGRWFLRKSHGKSDDVPAYSFAGELYEHEVEAFSADLDWMPKVVMIAKSTFVWLDQLSKQYGRTIRRLDEVPDEELDLLAARGMNALWFIGLWRRSDASKTVKHKMGNPDALASAYSLHGYEIAPDLGGTDAWRNLRDRAARRGIRLASDMVPNHTAIDSEWVMSRPDWFIRTSEPPFPNYSFTGPDLSNDGRACVQIEDGYWSRTDAAVVFKRIDRHTGGTTYIYHGNDGTSMPWNDTAQLDYLNTEVREAVIQTIVHVARMFPIIRFDAAMTLAKRHYARLWFPMPGHGGAIPSRSEYALTKERFDELMPIEFWREVVDRVAREAPETLLLAEAFWMMEGYFVRTLGMHRVYNSAFMNMLKREENAKYRTTIKNVLEYNPQILKRFVNFMNNPDEETAVAQFGRDDKYFGVCILMSTMPGLPMFGHGQVEGFEEKYGMEYPRAYRDETADVGLVERHEREIFPLLRKRWLFSEVDDFVLYDVFKDDGTVDEDVFAYSNRRGGERALVVVHNRFKETTGWIRTSCGFLDASGTMVQRVLGEGLALADDGQVMTVFRDSITGLEYIRENRELWSQGLRIGLGAFKYQVFLDFRQVVDSVGRPYRALLGELAGRGVPSVEQAAIDLYCKPVHTPLYEAIAPGSLAYLLAGWDDKAGKVSREVVAEAKKKLSFTLDGLAWAQGAPEARRAALEPRVAAFGESFERAVTRLHAHPLGHMVLVWLFLETVAGASLELGLSGDRTTSFDAWHLTDLVARALGAGGLAADEASRTAKVLRALVARAPVAQIPLDPERAADAALLTLLDSDAGQNAVGANPHEGTVWFVKECFEQLAALWAAVETLGHPIGAAHRAGQPDDRTPAERSLVREQDAARWIALAAASGYKLELLRGELQRVAPQLPGPSPERPRTVR